MPVIKDSSMLDNVGGEDADGAGEGKKVMSDFADELNAIREEAARIEEAEKALYRRIRKLQGIRVKILCPRYNGQPHGRSKRPLTGKIFTIAWALRWGSTIGVGFQEHKDGLKIEDVMFIREQSSKQLPACTNL